MTASGNAGRYTGTLTDSLSSSRRGTGQQPNDTRHAELRRGTELKAALSVAGAQDGRRPAGRQLLSTETRYLTVMERLQKVLADVDEATPPQLEALQRADKNARRQMSSVRVDSGTVRDFLPEQSKSNQRERFGREPRIAEERFRDEQKLRSAEDRIKKTATDQHKAVEQRLLATEQESVTTEQNLRRIDEWRQNVEDRLRATEDFQGTVQRLNDLQQQLTDAVSQIKTLEPKIKSCEDRLQSNTGLTIETKKTFDAQTGRLENLEISIGELVKQLQHLKADLSNIDGAKLKSFQSRLTSTRRMQGFAMIACIISLLLVTYVGMGNRGLSFVAQYISQWVPGLLI